MPPRNRRQSALAGPCTPLTDLDLHVAAAEGRVSDCEKLLQENSEAVKNRDYDGKTPIHVASLRHQVAALRALLDHCAATRCTKSVVNAIDNEGRSALDLAKNDTVKELLVAAGGKLVQRAPSTSDDDDEPKKGSRKVSKKTQPAPEEDPKIERTVGVVDQYFIRKVFVVVSIPFFFLLFVNGITFALKFALGSFVFYFFWTGFFVSELTICPPWYWPNSDHLVMQNVPDYWVHFHDPRRDFDIEYRDVQFVNKFGLTLRGWFMNGKNKMGIVLVHGGGRDRRAWLRHLPIFQQAGYGVLMFDFSDHGMSDGNSRGFTYGMRERFDVVAACKYMRETMGYQNIAAIGTSVGGASVIMAAALDPKIDVIIAENPMTTCAALQDYVIEGTIGPYFKHNWYSNLGFRLFRTSCSSWLNLRIGNKPSKSCQATHVISKISPRPVFLIHGTQDDVVPYQHSEVLYQRAKEPKQLWIAPDAGHCRVYNQYPDEFEQRVLSFLKTHEPK